MGDVGREDRVSQFCPIGCLGAATSPAHPCPLKGSLGLEGLLQEGL